VDACAPSARRYRRRRRGDGLFDAGLF
jgi:hypothetical protein